MERDVAGGLI